MHLSRTSPTTNPVLHDGNIADYSAIALAQQAQPTADGAAQADEEALESAFDPREWMVARVYSVAKGYIRVELPEPVEGIEKGHWR